MTSKIVVTAIVGYPTGTVLEAKYEDGSSFDYDSLAWEDFVADMQQDGYNIVGVDMGKSPMTRTPVNNIVEYTFEAQRNLGSYLDELVSEMSALPWHATSLHHVAQVFRDTLGEDVCFHESPPVAQIASALDFLRGICSE